MLSPTSSEPWSKKHKAVTRSTQGGLRYSLSNSFAEPLTHPELNRLTLARGDHALLEQYQTHSLAYTPNGGSLDLREEIAKMYGASISADNILVFAGAQVALQTAAMALAVDCHSIVFVPGYQSTVMAPALAGGNTTRIPLSAHDGWQIPLAKVRSAIRPGETRYMVINEPYNPAGTLMSHQQQSKLIALAEEYNIRILSDEVYRLLEHDPQDRLPAMCDAYPLGISCVTLSKPWGGCGISIGWLAFQDLTIKQRLVDVQYFGTACPSRASELQAIMALRASDVILERNRHIILRNLRLLDAFMATYNDLFEWVRPRAGAIAFIKFRGPLTSEQLGSQLAAAGISIKPAYCFTDTVTEDVDYFRIGYGEAGMPQALQALTQFVDTHKQVWREQLRETAGAARTERISSKL